MTWDDMDYGDRVETVWRMTHDGYIVREIAAELGTTPRIVTLFANREGLIIRSRLPAYSKAFRRNVGRGDNTGGLLAFADSGLSIKDRPKNGKAVQ